MESPVARRSTNAIHTLRRGDVMSKRERAKPQRVNAERRMRAELSRVGVTPERIASALVKRRIVERDAARFVRYG